ncbi:MAG: hypothetical protein FWD88_08305, partial [Treponema sp.]|nr:hypothetical protein [Treponema sp.]
MPLNFYDMWAQRVFTKNSYNNGEITYRPLDHEPITADSLMHVHLVILGMPNMGIALGIQAAHLCHFPNFITKGIKTRITFVDENADTEMNLLKIRLPSFFDEIDWSYQCLREGVKYDNKSSKTKFTDIEFEFIKARFEEAAVRGYIEQAACENSSYLTVAVAGSNPFGALSAALYLPPIVFDSGAVVLVRQEQSHAIVSMLSHDADKVAYRKYGNLRPFGMLNKCYDITHADDLLPMMIKYAYDNTNGEKTAKEFPEDVICRNWLDNRLSLFPPQKLVKHLPLFAGVDNFAIEKR